MKKQPFFPPVQNAVGSAEKAGIQLDFPASTLYNTIRKARQSNSTFECDSNIAALHLGTMLFEGCAHFLTCEVENR